MLVVTMKRGCPICGADLRGNEEIKYLCSDCMMLFERRHISKDLNNRKSIAPSMTIALFIGRFQPFHNGHLWAVKEILKDCDRLIIGIGSSQEKRTAANPYSAEERKEMINETMNAEDINCAVFCIEDINDDDKWVDHVKGIIPHFNVVYTGSPLSKKLFTEKGCVVKSLPRYKNISASEIRVKMLKELDYSELVPPPVKDFIELIKGIDIVKKASS